MTPTAPTPMIPVTPELITQSVLVGPNWILLMSLVYLGCALILFALAIGRGAALAGYSAEGRAVAAAHQAYGCNFAAFLGLIGLGLQGWAQFARLSFGSEVVVMFAALMALLIVYVFAADYLAEPSSSEMNSLMEGQENSGAAASAFRLPSATDTGAIQLVSDAATNFHAQAAAAAAVR